MKEKLFIIIVAIFVSYAHLSTKLCTSEDELFTIVHNSSQAEEKEEEAKQEIEIEQQAKDPVIPKKENIDNHDEKKETDKEVIQDVSKTKETQSTPKTEETQTKQSDYPQLITYIVEYINQERYTAVHIDSRLAYSTQMRAEEAYQKWSHTRPNGSHWDTTLANIIDIQTVLHGENLAQIEVPYQASYSEDELKNIAYLLHTGLKNSPTHYAVMTNENYKKVNVGIYTQHNHQTLIITIAQHYIC